MNTSVAKIFKNSLLPVCVTNGGGRIIYTNHAFISLFGLENSKLKETTWKALLSSSVDSNFFFNEFKKNTLEIKVILWNEEEIWLEFLNSKINYGSNLTISIIKDITERKNSELELIKSEQRFKNLFNNTNDAVLVCYINYGKTLSNFVEVNDVACNRLGYTKGELLELNPLSIVFGNFEGEVGNIIDKLFAEGQVIFEIVHLTKQKEKLPAEISAHLFNFNERPALVAISRDLTERKRVEEELIQKTEQLRSLTSKLQFIREEERTMIAREIHDELGQALTVLKIQTTLLTKRLDDEQVEIKEKLTSISELLDKTITSVQKITTKLRPGILDELGLVAAIEWQTQDFQERTGIKCDVNLIKEELSIEREKSTALFRIFQEALTNVARHANANRIKVDLMEFKNKLILEIIDNGKGITRNQITDPQSLGLLGMKERALIFGGTVEIKSTMKSGTSVKAEIPL
jgi:PAS domain S-box-containing protein